MLLTAEEFVGTIPLKFWEIPTLFCDEAAMPADDDTGRQKGDCDTLGAVVLAADATG